MRIKIGDLFEIPLADGRKALGHYVYYDSKNGPFIQVFDYITEDAHVNITEAINKPYLFPPVITGLNAAIRTGLWRVIGKKPVTDFIHPMFISSFWDHKTGEVINWFLYDGTNYIKLGPTLPVEYKGLEQLVVWSPYDIIERIETGKITFPFDELVENNKFTPRVNNSFQDTK